jgi:formylglycine-generating enzyme required for sulfatase activity
MHIFISYAKKDTKALAGQLRDALAALTGITAWMDQSIETGISWAYQIQREIDRCDYMVVLLSPDVNRDPTLPEGRSFVLNELDYALYEVKKPVIPVMAQKTRLPLQLAGIQYVDLTSSSDDAIDRAIKEVQRRTGIGLLPQLSEKSLALSSILPPPFEWIAIPDGFVKLKSAEQMNPPGTHGGRYKVAAFQIAKYPITNKQYEVFVSDPSGYHNILWWDYSPSAYQWRQHLSYPKPTEFEGEKIPRTNVSWYDAVAFCRWLTSRMDKLQHAPNQTVMLPTEQQWQFAAIGETEQLYPWGKEISPIHCNYSGKLKNPTPVDHYLEGMSPYGVMDMSGNVWEWCVTEWATGSIVLDASGQRLLRGGSWDDDPKNVQAIVRYSHPPYRESGYFGFRVALVSGF